MIIFDFPKYKVKNKFQMVNPEILTLFVQLKEHKRMKSWLRVLDHTTQIVVCVDLAVNSGAPGHRHRTSVCSLFPDRVRELGWPESFGVLRGPPKFRPSRGGMSGKRCRLQTFIMF